MSDEQRWVRTAHCEDIPLREGRYVRLGGRDIAIFNLGERFLAVDNRCPHKGGPLSEGIVSGATVICPLHSQKVSLETGDVLNSLAGPQCVETFRTRVEDGVILVEMPMESTAKKAMPRVCIEGSGQTLDSMQTGLRMDNSDFMNDGGMPPLSV